MLLKNGLLDDQGVLQLLELGKLNAAFCEGDIEPVNFCFEGGKLPSNAVNVPLPRLRLVVLPDFDLGKEFLFPVVGNSHECHVPLHFLREFLLCDQAAVVGMRQLVLVRTTVVAIPASAPFGVAFAGDAMSACGTGGEIQKEKSLVAPFFAGLADGGERGLNFIERLFGNHRRVYALVHFALVEKDAVIKWIAQKISNRRKRQWLFAQVPDNADCRQFFPNGGQRVLAGRKKFHHPLDLRKEYGVRLNRAQSRFVDISERSFARIYPPADFLADAAPDVR